ncbi:MAG: hypothetical protein ACJ748_04515 [Flavisolibacter sp.]
MHFYDFLQLNETEQIEILWYNGEQVGRRKDDDHLILLYQVEGFYVEVFYHNKERVIKKYISFECTDHLEPYLDTIDISNVYKYIKRTPKGPGNVLLMTNTIKENLQQDSKLQLPMKRNKNTIWDRILSIFHKP